MEDIVYERHRANLGCRFSPLCLPSGWFLLICSPLLGPPSPESPIIPTAPSGQPLRVRMIKFTTIVALNQLPQSVSKRIGLALLSPTGIHPSAQNAMHLRRQGAWIEQLHPLGMLGLDMLPQKHSLMKDNNTVVSGSTDRF